MQKLQDDSYYPQLKYTFPNVLRRRSGRREVLALQMRKQKKSADQSLTELGNQRMRWVFCLRHCFSSGWVVSVLPADL